MNHAPVFYTLAQVKFNPIQMVNFIPKLQDKLRHLGYPDFRQDTQQAWTVRHLDKEQPPKIDPQESVRWNFDNAERTEGYLLHSDALTFQTTAYDSFEELLKKLICGLNLIDEVIKLSYIERIGLRYLNAIMPDKDKKLQDYLNPSLLGFSAIINETFKHNFTEIMSEIDNGTLVARTIITNEGLAIPPDLFPLRLSIPEKFSTISGISATLDIDHFLKKRIDFDTRLVETHLHESHNTISRIFRAAVTADACNAWS